LCRKYYFSTVATFAAEAEAALDLQQELEVAVLLQEAADLVQALGAASLLTVFASAEAAAVFDLQHELVAADLSQDLVSLLTVFASAEAVLLQVAADLLQVAADLVQAFVVSEVVLAH
jgi:hypothetical protein